jgi:CheY-like chemotaxis protein
MEGRCSTASGSKMAVAMNELHLRILKRVVDLTGSSERLAASLKIPHAALLLWIQGKATIPAEVVEKLVDMIVAADVASLIEAARAEQAKPLPRVMVVDDDPSGAYSLARIIKLLGYTVETAADGPSAIEMARRIRPDVVFVDLRMPGMDGVELADALRSEGLAQHIVAATAYRSELERERTAAAGFAAHLVKPIERSMLEQVLTRLH